LNKESQRTPTDISNSGLELVEVFIILVSRPHSAHDCKLSMCLMLFCRLFYSYSILNSLPNQFEKNKNEKKVTRSQAGHTAARLSLNSSREKLAWLSLRQQPYVLILT
jgi:hypothetical protein